MFEKMMKCPYCGAQIRITEESFVVCVYCGREMEVPKFTQEEKRLVEAVEELRLSTDAAEVALHEALACAKETDAQIEERIALLAEKQAEDSAQVRTHLKELKDELRDTAMRERNAARDRLDKLRAEHQRTRDALGALRVELQAGKAASLQHCYDLAEAAQRAGRYDEAITHYQELVKISENHEAEVHWRIVLCRYGVEYVREQATGKWLPTVTHMIVDGLEKDEDYLAACDYARSDHIMEYYRSEAKRIDALLDKYRQVYGQERHYDVFISVKQGDVNGNPTEDSVIALDLYYMLKGMGLHVFNSRVSLQEHAGLEYEPYIMAALMTSKIMLVVGTKPEYLNAPWVRNEWRRYRWLQENGKENRRLIAYINGMKTSEVPNGMGALQVINAQISGSPKGQLSDVVAKHFGIPVNGRKPQGVGYKNRARRAELFLEEGNVEKCAEYVELALEDNPETGLAYALKLCMEKGVNRIEKLGRLSESFERDLNYRRAMSFGDDELKARLQEAVEGVRANIRAEEERKAAEAAELERKRREEEERLRREAEELERKRREEEERKRREAEELERKRREEEERKRREEEERKAREAAEIERRKREEEERLRLVEEARAKRAEEYAAKLAAERARIEQELAGNFKQERDKIEARRQKEYQERKRLEAKAAEYRGAEDRAQEELIALERKYDGVNPGTEEYERYESRRGEIATRRQEAYQKRKALEPTIAEHRAAEDCIQEELFALEQRYGRDKADIDKRILLVKERLEAEEQELRRQEQAEAEARQRELEKLVRAAEKNSREYEKKQAEEDRKKREEAVRKVDSQRGNQPEIHWDTPEDKRQEEEQERKAQEKKARKKRRRRIRLVVAGIVVVLGTAVFLGNRVPILDSLARNGSADQKYRRALAYEDGTFWAYESDAFAVLWYERAAEAGSAEAMHRLGGVYATGELGVEQDLEKSLRYLLDEVAICGRADPMLNFYLNDYERAAAENGEIAYDLSRMYRMGWGVDGNMVTAMKWCDTAIELGHEEAKALVGKLLKVVDRDPEQQIRKLTEADDAESLNYIGKAYINLAQTQEGDAQQEAFEKARAFLEAAQELDNPDALVNLGLIYKNEHYNGHDNDRAYELFKEAADRGRAWGACHIGRMAFYGYDREEEDIKSRPWFEKALELEKESGEITDADLYLGKIYSNTKASYYDPVKAFEYRQASADKNNPEGWFDLGYAYREGIGTDIDLDEALACFEKSLELGYKSAQAQIENVTEEMAMSTAEWAEHISTLGKHTEAIRLLTEAGDAGQLNRIGSEYFERAKKAEGDEQQQYFEIALKYMNAGVALGDGQSMVDAGCIYSHADYAAKDYPRAYDLFVQAAERNKVWGAYDVGVVLGNGWIDVNGDGEINDADKLESIPWYEKALEMEKTTGKVTPSDLQLGKLYTLKRYGTNDPAKGIGYLESSAAKNNAGGWYYLGEAYEYGRGVDVDLEEAARCYEKAAELGEAKGYRRLGAIYHDYDGKRDFEKAGAYFVKAAEMGDSISIYMLAQMAEKGQGMDVDLELANRCYAQAARMNYVAAQTICLQRGINYNDTEAYPDAY